MYIYEAHETGENEEFKCWGSERNDVSDGDELNILFYHMFLLYFLPTKRLENPGLKCMLKLRKALEIISCFFGGYATDAHKGCNTIKLL